ncbi:MAG: RecX family transcriptional regulator [Bacteroidales bacterium]|nr:RecX family transcriptional regulator [Bacteroidales bacterium]MCB8998574.1 RecX family transcriptional regulator [Bacteroidales bacterium]MCB9012558.1 RecX family transcriptional regulator [Bacteroidales bacterium]
MSQERTVNPEEALSRLQNLCSAREKCSSDILNKLRQWKIPDETAAVILEKLKKDKFVDDLRYAGFFVRDKQKFNKWGRDKIRFALMHKQLPKDIIEEVMGNLPAETYESSLRELLKKKSGELEKYNAYERKNRLIRFALQRGFDYDLIFRIVDDYIVSSE